MVIFERGGRSWVFDLYCILKLILYGLKFKMLKVLSIFEDSKDDSLYNLEIYGYMD